MNNLINYPIKETLGLLRIENPLNLLTGPQKNIIKVALAVLTSFVACYMIYRHYAKKAVKQLPAPRTPMPEQNASMLKQEKSASPIDKGDQLQNQKAPAPTPGKEDQQRDSAELFSPPMDLSDKKDPSKLEGKPERVMLSPEPAKQMPAIDSSTDDKAKMPSQPSEDQQTQNKISDAVHGLGEAVIIALLTLPSAPSTPNAPHKIDDSVRVDAVDELPAQTKVDDQIKPAVEIVKEDVVQVKEENVEAQPLPDVQQKELPVLENIQEQPLPKVIIAPVKTATSHFHAGLNPCNDSIQELVEDLIGLSPMDKTAMGRVKDPKTGKEILKFAPYRDKMINFMVNQFGMERAKDPHTGRGDYFVPGVPAFVLKRPLADVLPEEIFNFSDSAEVCFQMTGEEIKKWQESYRIYHPAEMPFDSASIQKWLSGKSSDGAEAANMKFLLRIAQTPVIRDFDGKLVKRSVDEFAGEIYLVSACGIDFATRKHDEDDIKKYILNWKEVVHTNRDGSIKYENARDMATTGKRARLNAELVLQDLKKMASLRLKAQDELGIEVVVETALGLGVFAGRHIGIEEEVRQLSVQAVKEVLQEEAFKNIKLVCFALPIFAKRDNFHIFSEGFNEYDGHTPILILDQDMHKIAENAAVRKDDNGKRLKRYITSELNPGDSHGVFGEYWMSDGPATEEKLAYTTLGLLTQHHAVNPIVFDASHYHTINLE